MAGIITGKKALLLSSGSGSPGLESLIKNFKKLGPTFGFEFLNPMTLAELLGPEAKILNNPSAKTYLTIAERLHSFACDQIVVLGGRGTFSWVAETVSIIRKNLSLVPVTVENDIWGCDTSLGFASAVEFAFRFVNQRSFRCGGFIIVEVAGRDSGFLALEIGLALGAQSIIFPDNPESVEKVSQKYREFRKKNLEPFLLVVNEGIRPGRSMDLAENIRKVLGINPEVVVIAPLQKRCAPCAIDQILSAKFAAKTCEFLVQDKTHFVVGYMDGKFSALSFENVADQVKRPSQGLLRLSQVISDGLTNSVG